MKRWCIEYWDDKAIEKWLDSLTKEELKGVAKELRMLEIAGNELKMPPSKPIGSGLFELRDMKFGFRLYYGFKANGIIVILAVGNNKSQANDIKMARHRLLTLK